MKILVVDDDQGLRKSLTLILEDGGHDVVLAANGEEGLGVAANENPQMILCDVRMPKMDGLQFLARYREAEGRALVIVMTAYGNVELAVNAMKVGAYDYLPKPFGADEVLLTIRKAEEREQLRTEVGRLRAEVSAGRRIGDIVARSPTMIRALETAVKVAGHRSPVLLTGESGTGKELMARLIHRESDRVDKPFIPPGDPSSLSHRQLRQVRLRKHRCNWSHRPAPCGLDDVLVWDRSAESNGTPA